MPSVSVTGSEGGPYTVTGETYEIVVSTQGITSVKLLATDGATTDVCDYISLCNMLGSEGAYSLQSAGTLAINANDAARVVITCTGDMKLVAGGDSKGTGTFYVACDPYRVICVPYANMTTAPDSGNWEGRPFFVFWNSSVTAATYHWADGVNADYAEVDPVDTTTARDTGTGPYSFIWQFTPNTNSYTIGAAVITNGYGTMTLGDRDNETQFLTYLKQTGLNLNTTYRSAMLFDFLPLASGAVDTAGFKLRRQAYTNPDDLVSEGEGAVIIGTRKTDHVFDWDADSFAEGYCVWTVTADANRVQIVLAKNIGALDVFHAAVQAYGVTAGYVIDYVKTSPDGINWTTRVDGTDYGEFAYASAPTTRFVQLYGAFAADLYIDMQWAASEALAISTTTLDAGEITVAYSESVAATGGTEPYAWDLEAGSDPLPDGLSLNASTGAITGTPTAAGTFTFTVEVTDDAAATDTQELSITIAAAPAITTTLGACENGIPYAVQLAAAGGSGGYAYTLEDGVLPTNLTLTSGGLLSGTPADTEGVFPITIRVTDSLGGYSDTEYVAFTLYAAVAITTTSLPNGVIGQAYSADVLTSGGMQGGTWDIIAGATPGGLVIVNQGWSQATIAGVPSASGLFEFTIQEVDALGGIATADLSITIVGFTSITTATLPVGAVGVAYSAGLSVDGGSEPYVWEVAAGVLPGGLSLDEDTGIISGTPTTPGTFDFTIGVTDNDGSYAEAELSIEVAAPPVVATTSLADATVDRPYSVQFTAVGGTLPLTWNKDSGDIPDGMTFDVNGLLSGTPTVVDTFVFTVRVTDAAANYTTRQMSLTVNGEVTVTTESLATAFWPGWTYSAQLASSGGTVPVTYAVTAGSLIPGLALASDGSLTGTPTGRGTPAGNGLAMGTATFTVTATDANGATGVKELTHTCIVKIFTPGGKPLIRTGGDGKPRIVIRAQDCCCHLTRFAEDGRHSGMHLYAFSEAEGTTLVAARKPEPSNTQFVRRIVLMGEGKKILDTLSVQVLAGRVSGESGLYTRTRWFDRVIYMNGKYYTWDSGWGELEGTWKPCYAMISCYDASTGEVVWRGLQGPPYESFSYPTGWYYTAYPWTSSWAIYANAGANEIWTTGSNGTTVGADPQDVKIYLTICRFSAADGSSLITNNGTARAGGVMFDVPDDSRWSGSESHPVAALYDAGSGTMFAWVLAASVNKTTGTQELSIYLADVTDAAFGQPTVATEALLDRIEWTSDGTWSGLVGGEYVMSGYPAWTRPVVWRIDGGYILSWQGQSGTVGATTINTYAVAFADDGTVMHGPDIISTTTSPHTDKYTEILCAYSDETCGYFGKWYYTDGSAIYRWDAETGAITTVITGYGICFPAPDHKAWVGGYHDGAVPLPYRQANLTTGALL